MAAHGRALLELSTMRVVMTSYTVTGSPPGWRPGVVGFAPESRGGAAGDDGSSERDGRQLARREPAAEINPPARAARTLKARGCGAPQVAA